MAADNVLLAAGGWWPGQPYFGPVIPTGPLTVRLGGWQCPGCGSCWNPTVLRCPQCGPPAAASDAGADGCEGGLCEEAPGDCRIGRCGC